MALYISKDGQQLGPYSIPEAQNLVRAGTLTETDWAWYEGLANWIPLNQIPGYISVALPPPPPVPVATALPGVSRAGPPKPQSLMQKIGGGIAAVAYAAFKFKTFAYAGLKTSLSMLFMIWIYSSMFGWPFAVGFVFLILVHELGHIVAAKLLGMPVTAPLFIPFVGAFITMKKNPRDAWTEALMAYGGPLAGCVGSWICLLVGIQIQGPWLIAIASASFVINLFNMIPVPPMDGGRICAAISTWFWLIGIVLLAVMLFFFHSWQTILVLMVIVILGTIPRLKQTFFGATTPELQAYYSTHISRRLIMAAMYLGLFAALALGYWDASTHLAYLWDNSQN